MLLCVVMCLLALATAQPYVPQPQPFTQCPENAGQVIHLGNHDVTTLTDQFAMASASQLYPTIFNVTRPGTTIYQLSLGLPSNLLLTNLIHLRLGIFYQSQTIGNAQGKMLAQSDEITVYPSSAMVLYANLQQPIALAVGTYQAVLWADRYFVTGGNEPESLTPNSGYMYYTPYGMTDNPISYYSISGSRALAIHGCQSDADPFSGPGIVTYSICTSIQTIKPAADINNMKSQASTLSVQFSGLIAADTTSTGTSATGTWITGRAARITLIITTASADQYDVPSKTQTLSLAAATSTRTQRFYPSATSVVDADGLVFNDIDGTQFTLRYVNGKYQLDSTAQTIRGDYVSTTAIQVGQALTCTWTTPYVPDVQSCPSGSLAITLGDSERAWAGLTPANQGSWSIMPGNWFYFYRFTVNTPQTEMRQLTIVALDNSARLIRLRLGLFLSTSRNGTVTHDLVAQTREVVLVNVANQLVVINLETPYMMTRYLNYSVGVISDQDFRTTYAGFQNLNVQNVIPYDFYFRDRTGLPSTIVPPTVNSMVVPLGGRACALQQTTRQFSVCASFVYDSEISVYSGLLTTLTSTDVNTKGTFVPIISGRGNRTTYWAWSPDFPEVYGWSVGKFDLQTDDIIYVDNTNNGIPIDTFGFQIVTTENYGQNAAQIASFYDPVSGSWEYRVTVGQLYGNYIDVRRNLVSSLSIQPYSGGALPVCETPPRPVNSIVPASSPIVTCPSDTFQIQETYGDVSIGEYAVRADGTTIHANRIYTHTFVPNSSGSISQLAVGLLRNTDRVGVIKARLGIYSSSFQLLAQADELQMEEAVDQMVVISLATPITVTSGQTYYIALVADALLEVATTAVANSPSMLFTLTDTGLPQTLVSSGNDLTVSVAAFACVQTTHGFCAFTQYATTTGESVTSFYSGLIQAGTVSTTDGYGSYVPIWSAGGFVSSYQRYAYGAVNDPQTKRFFMTASRDFKLYTTSTNNQMLDTTGIELLIDNVDPITLAFSARRSAVTELSADAGSSDYITSGFRVTPLSAGVPGCGFASIPAFAPSSPPAISCPAGSTAISFGTAKESDLEYQSEGDRSIYSGSVFSRTITTGNSAVTLHQIKFGLNYNFNTRTQVRMALYDSKNNFLAQTQLLAVINPTNQFVLTGTLNTPTYLAPNSVYVMAITSEFTIYASAGAKMSPSWNQDWSQPWRPSVEPYTNGEVALQGVGCTTATVATVAADGSSSSSSGVSDGAVAGIVIGCVIGTNLLLLACIWLFCLSGSSAKKGASRFTDENSNVESSRVEMS